MVDKVFKINYIYTPLQEDIPPIHCQFDEIKVIVYWTRFEIPGMDVVVYKNSYSYNKKKAKKAKNKIRILELHEPVVVHPHQYQKTIWKKFDIILTWNDRLIRDSPQKFIKHITPNYDMPSRRPISTPIFGVPTSEYNSINTKDKKSSICQINSNKFSLLAPELYSYRRDIPLWFFQHSKIPFDVYGIRPFKIPNYRGSTQDKFQTLKCYRYALCFQNTYHPIWSSGYITDELWDCMLSLTVPIYYGCHNIEEYVPTDCFIDYRRFLSPEKLNAYLENISDREYYKYIENIKKFLKKNDLRHKLSYHRIYEIIVELCERIKKEGEIDSSYPDDYLDTMPSIMEKAKFYFSSFWVQNPKLLKYLLKVYNLFR